MSDEIDTLRTEIVRLRDVAAAAHGLVLALRKPDAAAWNVAERAVVLALNASGTSRLAEHVRTHNGPQRIAELLVENERLQGEVEALSVLYRKADDGHDENMRETARLIGEVERLTADLATVRADHRTATGTLLAVAAAYTGWAIRGVGQHRAEYALEQIGKALGKPEVPTC